MNQNYIDTVRLLLAIAPAVFASGRFAMKGGTALNLFVQEMPRLSVDIDLVFVDHRLEREAALQVIASELAVVQAKLTRQGYRAHLPATARGDDVKLAVSNGAVQVKVEVNAVFRGTALPVEHHTLVDNAQNLFTTDLAVPVLATAELYGSKLVAAMDRQHPRDIFDVMHMLQRFGWQRAFIDCFVVYLAGHNRPVHEVLFPKIKPLEPTFTNEFAGMTREAIELSELLRMQARLLHELPQQLTPAHRDFLLSLVRGDPAWELMPMPHLRELPAIDWKLENLAKLKQVSADRFATQHQLLVRRFDSASDPLNNE
jgi:predicted nucleotidyltransferase component of viral defense system